MPERVLQVMNCGTSTPMTAARPQGRSWSSGVTVLEIGAGAFAPRAGGRWLAAIHWALRMSIMTIAQVSMLARLAGALAPGRGNADSPRAAK